MDWKIHYSDSVPRNDNERMGGFLFEASHRFLSKQCQGHSQHHFEIVSGSGFHLGLKFPVETPGASVI